MRCRVVSYGFGFRSVEGEGEAEEEENGQWEGQKKGERGTGGGGWATSIERGTFCVHGYQAGSWSCFKESEVFEGVECECF